jgi:hypothetical protein
MYSWRGLSQFTFFPHCFSFFSVFFQFFFRFVPVQSGVPWCTPGGAYPSSSDWLRSSNKSCPASESVVHTRIHVNTHVYTSRYQDAWELTRIYIHCIYIHCIYITYIVYTYEYIRVITYIVYTYRIRENLRVFTYIVYTCTFTRMHTWISGCMRTYAYIHVHLHAFTPRYQDACAHTRIYMYIYTYAHLDIRMHAHIRVYTCTGTRMHTWISGCVSTNSPMDRSYVKPDKRKT